MSQTITFFTNKSVDHGKQKDIPIDCYYKPTAFSGGFMNFKQLFVKKRNGLWHTPTIPMYIEVEVCKLG